MIAPQFCLDTKEAKSQDKKNLQPAGQLPARFFVGRLRAFFIVIARRNDVAIS